MKQQARIVVSFTLVGGMGDRVDPIGTLEVRVGNYEQPSRR